MRVLIYTEGDARRGMGHVERCLTLADELARRSVVVGFVTERNTSGAARIAERWLQGALTFEHDDYRWVASLKDTACFDVVVIDIADGPSREMMELFKAHYPKVVVVSAAGYSPEEFSHAT